MNKEQFMAMSHPYYLKVLVDTSHLVEEREPFIAVLAGLFDFEYYTVKYTDESCVSYTDINMRIKPILHPLSDLTKPIEHKGEVFVPIERILQESCFDTSKMTKEEIDSFAGSILMPELMSLNDALLLIEWHFDIAGLIEKGEAIDVNTLPENPYK